jgi:hypothetical protein
MSTASTYYATQRKAAIDSMPALELQAYKSAALALTDTARRKQHAAEASAAMRTAWDSLKPFDVIHPEAYEWERVAHPETVTDDDAACDLIAEVVGGFNMIDEGIVWLRLKARVAAEFVAEHASPTA